MTDHEALVAAVRAAPGDDTPRLVLADWLDDQGEAGSHQAAFVRGQIADASSGSPRRDVSRWSGRGTTLSQMFSPMVWGGPEPAPATLVLTNAAGTGVAWHRGCIEAVSAPFGAWLQIGHEVLRHNPVRYVHVHGRSVHLPGTAPAAVYTADQLARGDGDIPTGERGDFLVADKDMQWVVRLPAFEALAATQQMTGHDWSWVRGFNTRVLFESIFPGVRFLVTGQSPILRYPDRAWRASDVHGRLFEFTDFPEPVGREEWVVRRPAAPAEALA